MGKTIRLFGIFLILGPFSAMFAEPFFAAVFDKLHIDTEDWAVPVVTWLASVFSTNAFWYISFMAIGIGFGIWGHWLAISIERDNMREGEEDTNLPHPNIIYGDNNDYWKNIYLRRGSLNIHELACVLAGETPPSSIISSLEQAYEDEIESMVANEKINVDWGTPPLGVAMVGLPDAKQAAIKNWRVRLCVKHLKEMPIEEIARYYSSLGKEKEVEALGYTINQFEHTELQSPEDTE